MKNKTIQSGIERIEEIKDKITNSKNRKFCRAEVYETWDNIFKTDEEAEQ